MGEADRNNPWDRPWSIDEMRKSAETWSLASDSGMLNHLQEFSQKLMGRTHELQKQINGLINETKETGIRLHSTVNDFVNLANTQFVENRVYDEDITEQNKEEEKKEKTKEEREAEAIPRISNAVKLGLGVLESAFDRLAVTKDESDSDEEGGVSGTLLEPKDPYIQRPLPYLIGSHPFLQDDDVGLIDIPSEDEAVGPGDESSESEEEPEETKPKAKPPVKDQSEDSDGSGMFDEGSSDEDDFTGLQPKEKSVPETPLATADFASELAAKLGGVAEPSKSVKPEVPSKPVDPAKPSSAGENGDLFAGSEEEDEGSPFAGSGGRFGATKGAARGLFDDQEDEEGDLFAPPPMSQKGAVRTVKTDLFDDEDDDDDGDDIFNQSVSSASSKSAAGKTATIVSQPPKDLFDEDEDEEGDIFTPKVKPSPGSSATSHKKLPPGAKSMFGSNPNPLLAALKANKPATVEDSDNDSESSSHTTHSSQAGSKSISSGSRPGSGGVRPGSSPTVANKTATAADPSPGSRGGTQGRSSQPVGPGGGPVDPGGGLFDDETEEKKEDLFTASSKNTGNSTEHKKTASKPAPSLLADEDDDDDDGLFSIKPPKMSAAPKTTAASLFDDDGDDDDDDDLFAALSKPSGIKKPAAAAAATAATATAAADDLFQEQSTAKPQPQAQPQHKPKATTAVSLFDDDDEDDDDDDLFAALSRTKPTAKKADSFEKSDDLFSSPTDTTEKSSVTKKTKDDLEDVAKNGKYTPDEDLTSSQKQPSPKKKMAGAVSMFGQLDPTSILKTSAVFKEAEATDQLAEVADESAEAVSKQAPASTTRVPGFDDESDDDDDLFAVKPKAVSVPTKATPAPPPTKPKTVQSPANHSDPFKTDVTVPVMDPLNGEFSNGASANGTTGKKDLFTSSTNQNEEKSEDIQDTQGAKKKMAGAVSMFGQLDPSLLVKHKDPDQKVTKTPDQQPSQDLFSSPEENDDDLFVSPEKHPQKQAPVVAAKPPPTATKPGPTPGSKSPQTAAKPIPTATKPGSDTKPAPVQTRSVPVGQKLSKDRVSLVIDPMALLPGAHPPTRHKEETGTGFEDDTASAETLEHVSKSRARVQSKRRPPTRQGRRSMIDLTDPSDPPDASSDVKLSRPVSSVSDTHVSSTSAVAAHLPTSQPSFPTRLSDPIPLPSDPITHPTFAPTHPPPHSQTPAERLPKAYRNDLFDDDDEAEDLFAELSKSSTNSNSTEKSSHSKSSNPSQPVQPPQPLPAAETRAPLAKDIMKTNSLANNDNVHSKASEKMTDILDDSDEGDLFSIKTSTKSKTSGKLLSQEQSSRTHVDKEDVIPETPQKQTEAEQSDLVSSWEDSFTTKKKYTPDLFDATSNENGDNSVGGILETNDSQKSAAVKSSDSDEDIFSVANSSGSQKEETFLKRSTEKKSGPDLLLVSKPAVPKKTGIKSWELANEEDEEVEGQEEEGQEALFAVEKTEDVASEKITSTKREEDDIFSHVKVESSRSQAESAKKTAAAAESDEDDLFKIKTSSKPGKPTIDDDLDDLFAVPTKTSKPGKQQVDEDDIFADISTKSSYKPKKTLVKDEDIFQDTDDIFAAVPSPKTKRKKEKKEKEVKKTVEKGLFDDDDDDIFKATSKSTTSKKINSKHKETKATKPADDYDIFEDPLNAKHK